MKRGKSIISVILAVLMFMTAVPLSSFAGLELALRAAATYKVGDIVQFGSYPQSEVKDNSIIAMLNNYSNANPDGWCSYNYMSGTSNSSETWTNGSACPSNYMMYYDVQIDNVKYRGVKFNKYRPMYTNFESTISTDRTYQDNNGYYLNNIYWFSFDNIKWRILDDTQGLIMCESIIDAQPYSNTIDAAYRNKDGKYANDYASSSIRFWLNKDFYNTAFNENQQQNIINTTLDNSAPYDSTYNSKSTTDKVFLLSYNEIKNTNYGFTSSIIGNYDVNKRASSTDYAKCQGVSVQTNLDYKSKDNENISYWWLRSPGSDARSAFFVYTGNNFYGRYYEQNVDRNYSGIRPGIRVKDLASLSSSNSELGSAPSVHANDSITVKGLINKADESLDDYDHYILLLDVPTQYALYSGDSWLEWNGDQVTISQIQVDDAGEAYIGKHVEVTGNVVFGHTMHHLTEIVLTNCVYRLLETDIPESNDTFYEKSYIADIWLNQHKGVNTYESSELSSFLGYQSISTTLVNALLEDNWFKGALAGWEGFKGVFKTADSIKEVSYGIRELYESIIFDSLEKAVEAEAGDYQNIVLSAVDSLENGVKNVSPYMKFINDVVGSIGSSADVVRNLYLQDWHKSNISVGTLMNLDSVKQMSDKFTANKVSTNLSLFLNEAKSMADFFELVTSYQLAVTMGDEMKAFLSTMKSTTTDPYLESALGTVIAAVDNANWASIVCTTRFAENTAINVADAIIQGVINSNVYTAVLNIGYKVGKVASNLLSNTDGIISAYKACVAIDIFTNTSKKVISQLEEKYRSSGTETDAGAYVYAVKTYKDIYILDLERSVNLAKQASQKGIINLTKNKCKSLVNHILDKDETTTYEELCNSVETIKSSLELMFDSLFATWKYNTDYLKTDFPDQYAIYVKGDISSKLYAPQIVSTYLTNDGKVMLNYYNPCVYKDKTGTVHPLFGTAVLEGMKLSEVVNGAVTQELDFAYGFENQRVTLYDKNTFSDFPKTYLLRAYSTDTGSTAFTPTTNYELENPLKTPALVWTRGDLGQNCIGIIDETSSRYSPLMVYRIYRKDSRNGSFSQIATLKRDISITGNLTKYIDTTAQAGKLYIYKVQTEMKFSNGLSLISDESNEYELQGRANSRIDTLSLEVNFHGRTMKKTKGIAATAEDGENSVGVIINWISENNPSLYKYELYRKPSYSTAFEKVDCEIKSKVINLLSETRSYEAVDSTVDPGVEYEYLVITYKLTLTSSNGSFVARGTYDPVPIAQGTIQVPANDDNCQHNMMSDVVEEATCSHAGKNKYYCLYCGTEYENTIEELPHTYISSVTFKSTCSENGIKTYSCSVCGNTYTEPIPALGHIDENNDGYCDREGCGEKMTGGDHCPQCGKIHNGGFFDSIVGFFHKIIYRLTHLFG